MTAGRARALIDAALDASPVSESGLTHNFYRYPARFSPRFVAEAISTFTAPGDVVLDPFMGGGTTLVQALSLGRKAIGTDISALASFVSEVKTTAYSRSELKTLQGWAKQIERAVNIWKPSRRQSDEHGAEYRRHLGNRNTWRLRKAIGLTLESAQGLETQRLEQFARCVVLRTAQWALDGRESLPSVQEFRDNLVADAEYMIDGARAFAETLKNSHLNRDPTVLCLNRSAVGIEHEPAIRDLAKPKLVVTSPPYPGIHVLYHRWQIDGRKETPAPFWIANRMDGSGSAYYTMGDRKAFRLRTYFENLTQVFHSIAAVCDKNTMVVQVLAFSQPQWQLPRYLSVTDDAGFKEVLLPGLPKRYGGRLWRTVPHRKWHAGSQGQTSGSQEVVLFHKLK